MIKGQLQATETNDYGYARIKVSGKFYGADKKGAIDVVVGDIVEFDAYDKAGNNGKTYATFKSPSLRKTASAPAGAQVNTGPTASKDEYWSKKETADAAKEPKIAYFAAYERAVQFVALAHATGSLTALAKAKDTAKLEVLTVLVDEQAQRILAASYAQKAPTAPAAPAAVVDETAQPEAAAEDGQSWS